MLEGNNVAGLKCGIRKNRQGNVGSGRQFVDGSIESQLVKMSRSGIQRIPLGPACVLTARIFLIEIEVSKKIVGGTIGSGDFGQWVADPLASISIKIKAAPAL